MFEGKEVDYITNYIETMQNKISNEDALNKFTFEGAE